MLWWIMLGWDSVSTFLDTFPMLYIALVGSLSMILIYFLSWGNIIQIFIMLHVAHLCCWQIYKLLQWFILGLLSKGLRSQRMTSGCELQKRYAHETVLEFVYFGSAVMIEYLLKYVSILSGKGKCHSTSKFGEKKTGFARAALSIRTRCNFFLPVTTYEGYIIYAFCFMSMNTMKTCTINRAILNAVWTRHDTWIRLQTGDLTRY